MLAMATDIVPLSKRGEWISPRRRAAFIRLYFQGFTAEQTARKIAGNSDRHYRRILRQARHVLGTDPELLLIAQAEMRGAVVDGTPEMASGLMRRAGRGRVDAAKLALALSGIHNDRVQHDHSGEIDVRVHAMPRPKRVTEDGEIVDAEVVEDA